MDVEVRVTMSEVHTIPATLKRLQEQRPPGGRILSAYLDTTPKRVARRAHVLALRDGCKAIRAAPPGAGHGAGAGGRGQAAGQADHPQAAGAGLVAPVSRRPATTTARSERPTQQVVHAHGRSVRYRVAGAGEPVVLLHGLSGSGRWWGRTVPALAGRYRVYVPDLPGFVAMARSGSRGRFGLAEAPAWLLAWMEAVGLRSAHVVGHSMGGYVALRLAADAPEAVRRLVLVAPAGVRRGHRPDPMLAYTLPLVAALRRVGPGFLPLVARDALRAGPATVWWAARALLAADARPHLPAVAAPTLLIWGARDPLVPPAIGYRLRAEIGGARLLLLEGAGHVPMYERPTAFNTALLAFLAGAPVGE
jgi:pimeloyl-ACP methyl ester carboxylesterase